MSLPAWWGDAPDKRKQNRRAARQEREHAERTGGRVQPGSGSSRNNPQDVKSDGYLDECKGTQKASFPLKRDYWMRFRKNALDTDREPRMFIEFRDENDRVVLHLQVTEVDD